MNEKLQVAQGMFKVNEFILQKGTEDITPEKLTVQPDEKTNSLQFLIGHIVIHRSVICKLAGDEYTLEYDSLFKRGVEKMDKDTYPPVAQLLKDFAGITPHMHKALENVSDDKLAEATEGQNLLGDNTVLGSILFLAYHETTHAGQLMYVRKLLGYPGLVG